MKYRVFEFPIPGGDQLDELNQFLSNHRITAVRQHVVRAANAPLLVFVVEYVDGAQQIPRSKSAKIDYRQILSDEQFIVFNGLRDLRKQIAEQEGVPVYTIFTNSQLAEIVQCNVQSESDFGNISGVGKSRIDKYASQVLAVVADLTVSGLDRSN